MHLELLLQRNSEYTTGFPELEKCVVLQVPCILYVSIFSLISVNYMTFVWVTYIGTSMFMLTFMPKIFVH